MKILSENYSHKLTNNGHQRLISQFEELEKVHGVDENFICFIANSQNFLDFRNTIFQAVTEVYIIYVL